MSRDGSPGLTVTGGETAGLARSPRPEEDVAGRIDDGNVGSAIAVYIGDHGRFTTDEIDDRRARKRAVPIAQLDLHVVGASAGDRQIGLTVTGKIARDDRGRIAGSAEEKRRLGLERAVAIAEVHGIVVGASAIGIGGGQVEDAVIREIARDDRDGIHAITERHLHRGLERPIAVAQEYIDGIAESVVGDGDREVRDGRC